MRANPASPVKNRTKLRKLALAAQGLTKSAPFGRGLNGAARTLEHLGYVQIDTISVVQRAHHHILATRVPNYQPKHLNRLIERGDAFEYWHHAAAVMPMRDYRFAQLRMHDIKRGARFWMKQRDKKMEAKVLDRIKQDGPLRARDFDDPNHKSSGWWQWKPAKRALEQLFMQGDLAVASREGFQKNYDLPERVLPSTVDTRMPTAAEYAQHLLAQQLRTFGCATQKSVTYFQRFAELRKEAALLFKQQIADGELVPVDLPGQQQVFSTPTILASRTAKVAKRCHILSPFDNSVIQRERTVQLFDFDFQIECYVPEAKRQYGYFCLPLVFGDEIVGRMDCKAHRDEGRLEIRQLFLEDAAGLKPQQPQFCEAFATACWAFAENNQCQELQLSRCTPKSWLASLKKALLR